MSWKLSNMYKTISLRVHLKITISHPSQCSVKLVADMGSCQHDTNSPIDEEK
jgi:hypothetical protein